MEISQDIIDTVKSAALEAGALARDYWQQPRTLTLKGFRDLVTDADVAAQKLMTNMIRARFPDHGFLVEEEDHTLPAAGPVIWIIDPIDGTTNYSRQIAEFSVSIAAAAQINGQLEVLAGAVYDPMRDELFHAAAGRGAWLNETMLQVSQITEVDQALFALDWSRTPSIRQQSVEMLSVVSKRVMTVRAFGSAALALSWIAAGRLDAYLNLFLKPWDTAAGHLLLAEAGGQIGHPLGRKQGWDAAEILATNGHLHTEFVTIFSEHR